MYLLLNFKFQIKIFFKTIECLFCFLKMQVNDYKLLDLNKKIHKLMKFQGIFLHRFWFKEKNKIGCENDNNAGDNEVNFKVYLKKNDIIKRTYVSKLHLIYCIVISLIKIIAYPVIGYIDFQQQSLKPIYRGKNSSENEASTYFTKSIFVDTLIQVASGILYASYIIIPTSMILLSCWKNGFYKSVLSFEYFVVKLDACINNLNSTRKMQINATKHVLKIFSIIYCMCTVGLALIYCSLASMIINSVFEFIFELEILVMFKIFAFSFGSFVCIADLITGLYFFTSNVFIISHNVERFYFYLEASIEDFNENKLASIDFESIRDLYSDLYRHTKTSDKWICFFYGLNYLTTVPNICIFLYAIIFGHAQLPVLINIIPQMTNSVVVICFITFIGVMLNMKVRNGICFLLILK